MTQVRQWTPKNQVRILGFFYEIFLLFVLLLGINIFYWHHSSVFVTLIQDPPSLSKKFKVVWVSLPPPTCFKQKDQSPQSHTHHTIHIYSHRPTPDYMHSSPISSLTASLICHHRGLTSFIYFSRWHCRRYLYLGTIDNPLFTTTDYALNDYWHCQVGYVSPQTSLRYHNLVSFFIPKDSRSSPYIP